MRVRAAIACMAASATVLTIAAGPAGAVGPAGAATGNTISFRQRLQAIDGLGFAAAFQRATILRGDRGLSPESTRAVLDLLFDRETGAGASIVRIGIGSSTDDVYDHMKTIQPTDPGGPDAPPQYVWDGDDGAQVWFTKQAHRYGVRRFFADAWSAPGYMKTNGSDSNGGELCTGTADVDTSFRTDTRIHRAATYLTDETHSVERVSNVRLPGTRVLPVHLPARSLTTLVLR